LLEWGGALDSYGLRGLEKNMQVADHVAFLAGVLPVDAGGVFLPNVQTTSEVFADVYFFRRPQGTWILLLDATPNVRKRRALQQRAYDISLRAADLEQEGKALYDVNSMLEQRVSEQTAELSLTVVRLQQELAESKRTERALTLSESRFRSLYDGHLIGIVFWSDSGTITEANDTFLNLIGYSRDELARGAIKWNEISPTEPRPAGRTVQERSSNTLVSQPDERDFICKDGTHLTLLFRNGPYDESAKQNVGFVARTWASSAPR